MPSPAGEMRTERPVLGQMHCRIRLSARPIETVPLADRSHGEPAALSRRTAAIGPPERPQLREDDDRYRDDDRERHDEAPSSYTDPPISLAWLFRTRVATRRVPLAGRVAGEAHRIDSGDAWRLLIRPERRPFLLPSRCRRALRGNCDGGALPRRADRAGIAVALGLGGPPCSVACRFQRLHSCRAGRGRPVSLVMELGPVRPTELAGSLRAFGAAMPCSSCWDQCWRRLSAGGC